MTLADVEQPLRTPLIYITGTSTRRYCNPSYLLVCSFLRWCVRGRIVLVNIIMLRPNISRTVRDRGSVLPTDLRPPTGNGMANPIDT